jgi:HAD superfamily hydrolase (TIGR01549 family)
MITAAIFDIDGTLVDSVDLHAAAWQEAMQKFGHSVPFDLIRTQIGKGGDQLLPVFLTREELDQYGEALLEYRSEIFKKKYFPRVRPFPRIRDLFQRLKNDGKQLALASSAKGEELEDYKRIAQIEDLVDEQTSSDDAERSKPHPDIFQAALARLHKVEVCEAVVIGDSPYDAIAAGKLGLRAIGVRSGGFPERDLRAAGFNIQYNDCADLLDHYKDSVLAQKTAA